MSEATTVTVQSGGIFGNALAVGLSWVTNHSVGWAILHAFCGWIYVVYNVLVYGLPHLPTR